MNFVATEKKIELKACKKPFVDYADYFLENNDPRYVCSHCRLKMFDCPINYR